jgi:mannose-1-phosphate guanylyltransferase
VEKPDPDTARRFFESPDYLVNSGMFILPIRTIMEEIHAHLPAMGQGLERIASAIDTPLELKALGEEFPRFETISIDKGVMERTRRAVVLPARFGWNDLGSWSSLYDEWPKDENSNACIGRKLTLNTRNTLIYSPKKLVAAVGVSDLVIVETDDALLVCHKDCAQDVSELVEIMRRERMEEFL